MRRINFKFLRVLLPASAFLLVSISIYPAQNSYTLDQAFSQALKQSEQIGIDQKEIKIQKEKKLQAIGEILPRLSFETRFEYENERRSSSGEFDDQIASLQTQADFVYRQALFQGGREYFKIKRIRYNIKAARQALQLSRNDLYRELAVNFYDILRLERDYKLLNQVVNLLKSRRGEISQRAQIGLSPDSEGASAQARLQEVLSEVALVKAQIQEAQLNFFYLTGLQKVGLQATLPAKKPQKKKPIVINHPEIKQAQAQLKATQANKTISRLAFVPSIDIESRYLAIQPEGFRPSEFNVNLFLNVPIVEGGIRISQAREADLRVAQDKLQLKGVQEKISQEIKRQTIRQQAAYEQMGLLKRAAQAAYRAYGLELKDYKDNLVTNLEVLESLEDYLETQQKYNQAWFVYHVASVELDLALGNTP